VTSESDFIKRLLDQKEREKAFKTLLDLYQKRLYWHIRKIVITHENADDVLQNTFLRIYKSLANFKQESSLNTWMYRIAYNESVRFLELNKKKTFDSLSDVNDHYLKTLATDPFFDGDEIQLKLHNMLAILPEKDRQIFQMKYYDDLQFKEIAEVLNINENTIKTSYYRTAKVIKKNIQEVELFNETGV
jgi:RNA polymerase sigma factor (sigma-70 family)